MANSNLKTVKILTVVLVSLLMILSVVLIFQLVKIGTLQSSEAELQSRLNSINEQKLYYSSENSYLETDAFLDRYAREILNLGKPGEFVFK